MRKPSSRPRHRPYGSWIVGQSLLFWCDSLPLGGLCGTNAFPAKPQKGFSKRRQTMPDALAPR